VFVTAYKVQQSSYFTKALMTERKISLFRNIFLCNCHSDKKNLVNSSKSILKFGCKPQTHHMLLVALPATVYYANTSKLNSLAYLAYFARALVTMPQSTTYAFCSHTSNCLLC
jgi:hypothetical protein